MKELLTAKMLWFKIILFAAVTLFCRVLTDEEATRKSTGAIASGAGSSYLSSKLFGVFLDRALGVETPKELAVEIEIANQMTVNHIANPRMYLLGGHNTMPPALVIPPANGEDIKKSLISFRTSKNLPLLQAVSSGVVAYEIRSAGMISYILYMAWDVRRREVSEILQTSGQNYFGVFLEQATADNIQWDQKLPQFLNGLKQGGDTITSSLNMATGVGKYVTVNKDDIIYARATMTDSNPAKMIVKIWGGQKMTTFYKRDFGVSLASGLIANTLGPLTNRLINKLAASRTIVLTIKNEIVVDKVGLYFGNLQNPIWQSSGVEFVDPVPYEIPKGAVNQVTARVELGMGVSFLEKFRNSVLVISYQIFGTKNRLVFVIKWQLAITNVLTDNHNWYSVLMLKDVDDEKAIAIQKEIMTAVQKNSDEKTIQDALTAYQKNFLLRSRALVPLSPGGGDYMGYSAWYFSEMFKMSPNKPENYKYTAITMLGTSATAGELVVHFRWSRLTTNNPVPAELNPVYYTEEL